MADTYDTQLRHFKDLDDLFDNIADTTILEWVNKYHKLLTGDYKKLKEADDKRREYHKVHQQKRKLIMAAVTEHLSQDEIEHLKKLAEEKVAERAEEA